MCVTDGDVCEVLEGCWVNVGAFVSRLGELRVCVCGCAGVGPAVPELGGIGRGCVCVRQSLSVTAGSCELKSCCDSGRLVSLRPGVVYVCGWQSGSK